MHDTNHSRSGLPVLKKVRHRVTSIRLYLLFCALMTGTAVQAADGDLDTSFGSGGTAITALGSTTQATAVRMQSDGKVVIAGSFDNAGNTNFLVVRYTAAGALDATFGTGGVVTTPVGTSSSATALAIQSDGKIVVVGTSDGDVALARYTATGTLDSGFGSGGIVTTAVGTSDDEARGVVIQADGKVLIVGRTFNGTNQDMAVVRYTSTGALDATFGTGGKVVTNFGSSSWDSANAVALQSDGKIVVGGDAGDSSKSSFALLRYASTGVLDVTFGTGGKATASFGVEDDEVTAIAIQSDGKIVLAGDTYNGNPDVALARFTTSGALDATFGAGGQVTTTVAASRSAANALVIQSDGKLVVAGYAGPFGSFTIFGVRYDTTGALDTTFGTGGKVTTAVGTESIANAITIQDNGRIVVAGWTDSNVVVARYANTITPVVTSTLLATANAGSAFTYSITGSNAPTSYNATGLPGGLAVNTGTGVISGTPTVVGVSAVTISATNASGTGTATLTLSVNGPLAPVVSSTLTKAGTVGASLTYTITATNTPTSYNATGLPTGLAVNTVTGVISGTPTVSGTTNVTISATNADGIGTATLVMTIGSSVGGGSSGGGGSGGGGGCGLGSGMAGIVMALMLMLVGRLHVAKHRRT